MKRKMQQSMNLVRIPGMKCYSMPDAIIIPKPSFIIIDEYICKEYYLCRNGMKWVT